MKPIFVAIIFILSISCSRQAPVVNNSEKKADYLLQENSIRDRTEENRALLKGICADINSFKTYLNSLSNDSLFSIPFALDYIKTCMKTDSAPCDSVVVLFNEKVNLVINKLSDSLETKYAFLIQQMDKDSITPELRAFNENLATCGIGIYMTEGMYYPDVMPEFFYSNFKNIISPGFKEFLNIRKDELKEGFSEDAGLLISFEDLYKRVKRWEDFISVYPTGVFVEEANGFYTIYLETLMTGMDNSRIFDFDDNSLSPEIKTLYESIMMEDSESPTSKIITSYYNFLSRHNFKENDSIRHFMEANRLSGMLGVQPHTR